MTITNHALAGAAIALSIKQPAVALPLAVASHYAMDALPHYGYAGHRGFTESFKHRLTYFHAAWSGATMLVVAFWLLRQPLVVGLAAFLAVAPDFYWLYRYWYFERHGRRPPGGPLTRFHQGIQWCERPWGIVVELMAFGLLFAAVKALARA